MDVLATAGTVRLVVCCGPRDDSCSINELGGSLAGGGVVVVDKHEKKKKSEMFHTFATAFAMIPFLLLPPRS